MSLFVSYQKLGLEVPDSTGSSDDIYLDVYTISGVKVYGNIVTVTFSDGSPDMVFDGGSFMGASYYAGRLAAAANKNKVVWDGTTI